MEQVTKEFVVEKIREYLEAALTQEVFPLEQVRENLRVADLLLNEFDVVSGRALTLQVSLTEFLTGLSE
jgi:hypothetical protein